MKRVSALLRQEFGDVAFSTVYRTSPRDHRDQPDFLNAVARVITKLTVEEVFEKTRGIESSLDKALPYPKGPRTIDIDLLLYGDLVSDDPKLKIPHPRLHERRFVLEPLCELIGAGERHPILGMTYHELLAKNLDQVLAVTDIRL